MGILVEFFNFHGGEETNKTWWDIVDYIGVNAFYPIAPDNTTATARNLYPLWQRIVDFGLPTMKGGLKDLHWRWNKTILFTAVGYCSGACPEGPQIDIHYQTTRYQAIFNVFRSFPWFEGAYWWNWVADASFGGIHNYCATPQFKPAEELIRKEYGGKEESIRPDAPPVCPCF